MGKRGICIKFIDLWPIALLLLQKYSFLSISNTPTKSKHNWTSPAEVIGKNSIIDKGHCSLTLTFHLSPLLLCRKIPHAISNLPTKLHLQQTFYLDGVMGKNSISRLCSLTFYPWHICSKIISVISTSWGTPPPPPGPSTCMIKIYPEVFHISCPHMVLTRLWYGRMDGWMDNPKT